MAGDIFLKVDDIKGESYAKGHEDEIDILAWSWGVSQQGSMHTGGGGGKGRSDVHDITFTKSQDLASVKLFEACLLGKHIPNIVLSCNKASGGKALEFMKIKMEACYITSMSTGGTQGADFTESFTVTFAKVTMDYNAQDEKGSKKGSNTLTYDVKANS